MAVDLRGRLALALVGVSVTVAGLLAAMLWSANLWMQRMTLDHFLARELSIYLEAHRDPIQIDSDALGLRYFRPAQAPELGLPASLRELAPGVHPDVRLDDDVYYVLVREINRGDRAYLAYSVKAFKLRERWLSGALVAGVIATALLAWFAGRWSMRHALRPLDGMVARIRHLDPGLRQQRLEPRPDDGELRVIVTALNGFMQELDRVLVRERVFAAAAAHELRTPLTAIQGAAEVLAAAQAAPEPVLTRIQRSVTEASNDLDALLALSQGRELPPARPLRLDQLLPELAQAYAQQAQEQRTRLTWQIAGPVTLESSPGVIGLIFSNLLRNALRAAPGGEIRIALEAGVLAISDNGEGIPPELLPKLFEPGTRGREGGSGLGLYIAQTLARRCGWTLSLRNNPGAGACAELRFH